MKSKFLFPTWARLLGYLMAIPGFILGYLTIFSKYEIPGFVLKLRERDTLFEPALENFTNELAIFLVILGLILVAFSKNKREDELSAKIRLNALYWSVAIYYVIYLLALGYSIVFGEIPFVGDHATELNIFTPLLIFVIRYNYLKYMNQDSYLLGPPRFLANKPYRIIGIVVSVMGFIFFSFILITDPLSDQWSSALMKGLYFIFIVGLLLWAFSQHQLEDEMTMQQRLESLQLAVYFNYLVLLIATLVFYSLLYLYILSIAQFSLLIFFVIRMEYVRIKNKLSLNVREEGLTYEK